MKITFQRLKDLDIIFCYFGTATQSIYSLIQQTCIENLLHYKNYPGCVGAVQMNKSLSLPSTSSFLSNKTNIRK